MPQLLRDGEVPICNFVDMTNHDHTHVIPARPGALLKMYGEDNQPITEALKGLVGLEQHYLAHETVTWGMKP